MPWASVLRLHFLRHGSYITGDGSHAQMRRLWRTCYHVRYVLCEVQEEETEMIAALCRGVGFAIVTLPLRACWFCREFAWAWQVHWPIAFSHAWKVATLPTESLLRD